MVKKSLGICTLAKIGLWLRACQKAEANAAHKAGGYSFKIIVLNFPSLPCPMLAILGSSSTTRHCRIDIPKVGKFRERIIVGLADTAPRSPCANYSHNLKPGNCKSRLSRGVFQMDADVSFGGRAGCSIAPHPPFTYKTVIIRKQKSMSWLPTKI